MTYSFTHTIEPRPNSNDQLLIDVLDGLLSRYLDRVPAAGRVVDLILKRGDTIINDHIAFRSIHIESILTIFIHLGYEVKMNHLTNKPFNFESKKLTAVWLKHPNPAAPRVFVSQFRYPEGSKDLQQIIDRYLVNWTDPIKTIDLNNPQQINKYLHTAQWPTPSYNDYCALQDESEYVSWVLYNKYYLNHFTLSVHHLDSFKFNDELNIVLKNYHESYKRHQSEDVLNDAVRMMKRKYKKHFLEFNNWLSNNNFTMNAIKDGVMNISPDECLLQSSTKSEPVMAEFDSGSYNIPGSYVEFAYRGIEGEGVKHLVKNGLSVSDIDETFRREGFETQNADKIFESTYIGKESSVMSKKSAYDESCRQIMVFLNQR